MLLPLSVPLPSQACMKKIKLARKTKKTKKLDAKNVLLGGQQDLDPGQWVMMVLVRSLHSSNMDKTPSTIKVELRTIIIDQ